MVALVLSLLAFIVDPIKLFHSLRHTSERSLYQFRISVAVALLTKNLATARVQQCLCAQ